VAAFRVSVLAIDNAGDGVFDRFAATDLHGLN
jgi:hypothetical protein